jgi:hypothetical protein
LAAPREPAFVLDENFPETVIPFVALHVPQVRLVPWKDVDRRLEAKSDPELIRALWQAGYPGAITLNWRMINFLDVLAMILQTRFTLIALEDAGEMPIQAAGLLLLHLPYIAKEFRPGVPQIWRLRRRPASPTFDDHVRRLERQLNDSIDAYRLSEADLHRPVLPP